MKDVAEAVSPTMQLPEQAKEVSQPDEESKEPVQPPINPEPVAEANVEMKDEEMKEEEVKEEAPRV